MSKTRVRFAPSPTGSTHIGTARTALFNWLYARKTGGTFVLRIEDTDKERNTEAALDELINGLKWLGLDWDEGPEAGGPFGPYFQSERGEIYEQYLQKLKKAGRTYEKDGAIFFKLEGERYTEFDDYLKEEVEKVRTEPVIIRDLVRGDVTRREDRDFVIVRSNGDPSFHFVNVVDDIAMEITHVIRGEDHLPNTSKHIELYKAFGVEAPYYAHLPLILKDPAQGKGKMSKRERGFLIEDYINRDFIPEAAVNFFSLIGWSPKDDQEVMGISDLVDRFDIKGIQKSGARFDEKKMSHINFEYMKKMAIDAYALKAKSALSKAGLVDDDTDLGYIESVSAICQEKIDSFENLPSFAAYFFTDDYKVDEKAEAKLFKKGEPLSRIQEAFEALSEISPDAWTSETVDQAFQDLATAKDLKVFAWYPIVRFAVSGVNSGPDFLPMLATLGKDRAVSRLQRALAHYRAKA